MPVGPNEHLLALNFSSLHGKRDVDFSDYYGSGGGELGNSLEKSILHAVIGGFSLYPGSKEQSA